ncbi:ATRX family protein [Megaselia abdita]
MSTNSKKKKNKIADSESNNDSEHDSYQSDDSMSSMEVLPSKNRKRVVRPKDSSEDEDYGEAKPPPKVTKKKAKKKGSSSSSGDDDDDEKAKTKRKNIRKLIKTKDLEVGTKQAAKEEEERKKRIEERQKKYNEIYEKPESVELEELILDFDEETNEPLLQVDKGLIKLLKPHQAKGVKFMWDACFETVKDAKEKPGSGCILAHCMGLGKTLQVVTLTHTLITNQEQTDVERALIISPLSTLSNWAREFKMWMKHCKEKNIEVYDLSRFKDKATRIFKLQEWFEEGGVCIMGYDMYRIFSNEKAKGLKKKQRETLMNSLIDPGPDIVVCDEGHLLKNEKTSISKAVTRMRTRRRVVLTGTPLQNNLKEYYCMIQFIKPNLLGTYKEYLNRFVNPITNGQYADSTMYDMRLMKHRSHILHKLLEGCIQRRDYSVLAPYLPPKHEYVVYVTLSDIQKVVYEFYMREQRRLISEDSQSKGATLFQDFQNLRRIWTHPMCLRVNSDTVIQKKMMADDDEEGSLKDFIDDDTSDASSANSSESEEDASSHSSKKKKSTRGNPKKAFEMPEDLPPKEDASEWWMKMVPDEELNNINNSPKLLILFELLRECAEIGDKILVFSQSLQSLDVIEQFLSMIDQKTQGEDVDGNVGDYRGSWQPNVDYFRLDGSRSVDNREAMCKVFNDKNNLRARLFLISTRAGGLGINLVAANRVVIFDVSWNPSHDTQSIFRVYRFGQDKPCYIYRLLAMGTMEQKVYERQVTKQATAKRVIDEQQISRHYNQNDLQELYTYELEPQAEREIPILPKDKLFAELLSHREKMIFKYHEHDSLLENEVSENLTEEERKAAWSEYEAEKSRPTTAASYIGYNRQAYGNFGSTGPVTTNKVFGFRTDVLLRLLNMKAHKDNPMIPMDSTGNLIPLYMQRLNTEMNSGDPTMYKELLELHAQLESPFMNMNPLLYANQNPVFTYPMAGPPQNTQYHRPTLPPATETIEILDD